MNSLHYSVTDFQFHSTVTGKHTLYDCNSLKFIIFFNGPGYTLLENVSCALEKNEYFALVWWSVL